jgi:hypothetical protein
VLEAVLPTPPPSHWSPAYSFMQVSPQHLNPFVPRREGVNGFATWERGSGDHRDPCDAHRVSKNIQKFRNRSEDGAKGPELDGGSTSRFDPR